MSSPSPWIYRDKNNDIWEFCINQDQAFSCKLFRREAWGNETIIDKDVLGFTLYLEEDDTIHALYSTSLGDLKYCTRRKNQWLGKKLYHMESDEFFIQDIKMEMREGDMHIFYMLIANDGSDHAVLMHCIWNGKESNIHTLQDIILVPGMEEHYIVQARNQDAMDIFFMTDEGSEGVLYYCSYENNQWSTSARLYGLKGEDLSFNILRDGQEIHIINRAAEESRYVLEHIYMNDDADIQSYPVYKSAGKPQKIILLQERNLLYAAWIENGNIFYSTFNGKTWGEVMEADISTDSTWERYHFIQCDSKKQQVEKITLYGNSQAKDFYIVPEYATSIELMGTQLHGKQKVPIESIKELENLKGQLKETSEMNKILENQLKNVHQQMEETEEKNRRLENQLGDMNQRLNELEQQVLQQGSVSDEIDKKIQNRIIEEIRQLEEGLEIERNKMIRALESSECEKEELRNRLQDTSIEKERIKQQAKASIQEYVKLQDEMERERKLSFLNSLKKR